MIKLFFRTVRAVLGPILLVWDKLFPAKKLDINSLKQDEIAAAEAELILYQFKACPFCIKVRRQIRRLHLNIETRNVLENQQWHDELEQQGGKRKVPCLRIAKAGDEVEWLYESNAINHYLSQRITTANV